MFMGATLSHQQSSVDVETIIEFEHIKYLDITLDINLHLGKGIPLTLI